MSTVLAKRRFALFSYFFFQGLAMSTWVTRTPAVRDLLGASTAEMGLVLFGLSIGSMASVLTAGALLDRFGARSILNGGLAMIVCSLVLVGIGADISSAPIVWLALLLMGLALGSSEVAGGVDGSEVERRSGRSVIPLMHGSFSLGTVVGSLGGIAATAAELSVLWHLATASAVVLPVAYVAFDALPKMADRAAHSLPKQRTKAAGLWKDRQLLFIGAIVLAMALAEGSANDWLPLLMVDDHGFDATSGSLIFTMFAVAMTIGRFGGSLFVDRFGRVVAMRASAVIATLGIATVVFVDEPVVAGSAVLLWGIGASLGFPVAMSAAGASQSDGAARVRVVAVVGYCAFLAGPPLLGFLGDHFGLRSAMTVVLMLIVATIPLSTALRE